jgi:hypothetical protein
MAITKSRRFHGRHDTQPATDRHFVVQERSLEYDVFLHQHPFVGELVRRLLEDSVGGLQAADTADPPLLEEFFAAYQPDAAVRTRPVRDLDFSISGAYAPYNWELFFHVPLTVAMHLSKNGRFEDAQRWFHYVFDPTDAGDGPTPERFWKVRPFQTTDVERIEEILVNLSSGADPTLRDETIASIDAWRQAPFHPHVVAQHRPSAYMFKTVMAYLDNLIAWGDSLFRQDTREAINEAAQLYVLAAGILGPRPQEVPSKGRMRPQTYASLKADLDAFGNALRDLETDVPFELVPMPSASTAPADGAVSVASLGQALYFGVPRNDRLLGYWTTVADRLFKIRNSLDIRGVFRQLPLFDPPIDPGLLARAAAAGVDVAAIVSGANQPLPLVRFTLLVQKAGEIAQEVKSLGGALLAALEKQDGEALQILRARHERGTLEAAESVKYGQWQDAIKAREGIEQTMAGAVQRYVHYERQLGRAESDISVPDAGTIDPATIISRRFRATEPEVPQRELAYDIALALQGLPGGFPISSWETAELAAMVAANLTQIGAGVMDTLAGVFALVPQFHARVTPWGLGAGGEMGGEQISKALGAGATATRTVATGLEGAAAVSQKLGTYQRRAEDWAFQSNVTAAEITQLYKQLRGAQIREALAELEWHNHQTQIENAREIERFLSDAKTGKTTNQDLYAWMTREVKGLYGRCFDLAFDIARKAERALQAELGDPNVTFLRYDYLAGNEGLLAGERLWLDVKRMELAHHDLNRREYELSRSVSLLELDPDALVTLRMTGTCTFTIPEELYDLDAPGHYFRRIRSVALTIPGVAGPYTSVSATLTQLKSTIRLNAQLSPDNAYARDGADDPRFADRFASLDTIVTSSAQSDGGVFDLDLRDERLLPFERTGAVSQWQLQLPADIKQFDHDTIADVIVHVRYTAREGGAVLRSKATDNLEAAIAAAGALGSVRLFSVRRDFPTEWARFTAAGIDADHPTAALSLTLRPEHYPFWSRKPGRLGTLQQVVLLARTAKASVTVSDADGNVDVLTKQKAYGNLRVGPLVNIPAPAPTGTLSVQLDDNSMDELWLTVAWGR